MIKAITPLFLRKLDQYLLENYPVVWISKIHHTIWYGAWLWLLGAAIGFIVPFDLTRNIQYEMYYFFFTIVALAMFCIWVYQYVIFNKEKNYGTRSVADEYLNFILVLMSSAIFAVSPVSFQYVYSQRIANVTSDEILFDEINTLNQAAPYIFLNSDYYERYWDSSRNESWTTLKQIRWGANARYTPYFIRHDSLHYPILTPYQLYKKHDAKANLNTVSKKISDYIRICNKYGVNIPFRSQELAAYYMNLASKESIWVTELREYYISDYEIDKIISNISEAKFKDHFIYRAGYFWTILYVTLTLTCFLLLFKLTYWKQFIVLLVTLMFYPMIAGILSLLVPNSIYRDEEDIILGLNLFAIYFAAGVTLMNYWKQQRFSAFVNVATQVFYVMLIYTPLLTVVFLHETTNIFHQHDFISMSNHIKHGVDSNFDPMQDLLRNYWREEYQRWLFCCQLAGIAAYILLLPVLKQVLVKQLALPKKT